MCVWGGCQVLSYNVLTVWESKWAVFTYSYWNSHFKVIKIKKDNTSVVEFYPVLLSGDCWDSPLPTLFRASAS